MTSVLVQTQPLTWYLSDYSVTAEKRRAENSCLHLGGGLQPQVCVGAEGVGKETPERIHTSPALILGSRESETRSAIPDGPAQDRHNRWASLP